MQETLTALVDCVYQCACRMGGTFKLWEWTQMRRSGLFIVFFIFEPLLMGWLLGQPQRAGARNCLPSVHEARGDGPLDW
jgi:hypothetical protein